MAEYDSKISEILNALRRVVGEQPVYLHEPYFFGNEWAYVKDCLDSTFVSSVGKYVDRFEEDLARYTGSRYAVATVNGTSALHMALLLAGVEEGDEVLIPSLSFVATANAVAYCGATPHFIDIEENFFGIDVTALDNYLDEIAIKTDGICRNRVTGKIIRSIVPMHTFGHVTDMDEIVSLADRWNLNVVEDAAEALGSYFKGKHAGTFGKLGIISFNGNKTITTGGGGAILTDDESLARKAKHLTTTAKISHRWEYVHDQIGFNYRMPNINAALGCAQLEKLPEILKMKRTLHSAYEKEFREIEGVKILLEPPFSQSNYWLQTLVLDPEYKDLRDPLLESTNNSSIMTRPVWSLLHNLNIYAHCPGMSMECSEKWEQCLINIPSSIRNV